MSEPTKTSTPNPQPSAPASPEPTPEPTSETTRINGNATSALGLTFDFTLPQLYASLEYAIRPWRVEPLPDDAIVHLTITQWKFKPVKDGRLTLYPAKTLGDLSIAVTRISARKVGILEITGIACNELNPMLRFSLDCDADQKAVDDNGITLGTEIVATIALGMGVGQIDWYESQTHSLEIPTLKEQYPFLNDNEDATPQACIVAMMTKK